LRTQKYYLSVPTKWFNVEECPLCNPVDENKKECPRLELALYETDRTAVTPSIIFDFPRGRMIAKTDLDRKYVIDSKSINYGHHTRNNSHFLYAINSEDFLERNRAAVEKWLTEIKKSAQFKLTYKDTDHVIIISACHYSNASFINLVNEYLFSASANIIHYDPSNDYIQNFKMVYGREINDADTIFFIDDSLKSGNAFDKIYQFVQNTLETTSPLPSKEAPYKEKGMSCCFFLLNKSQPYTFFNVRHKLVNGQGIYAFANLHLYTSLKSDEISPLQIEEERYLELARNCFLDSLKVHFLSQARKLNSEYNSFSIKANTVKAGRHLGMLIATHRLYQYFKVAEEPMMVSYRSFIKDLLDKTASPIENISSGYDTDYVLSDLDTAYLKVLTQSPFTQYKPLKTKVFEWIINLLIELVEKLKDDISKKKFNYKSFQELKFLIRRAGLLNSNYLFSKSFFCFLKILYSENGIPRVLTDTYRAINASKKSGPDLYTGNIEDMEDVISKLKEFHIFYTAQLKELLLKNESRCIRIERHLVELDESENLNIKQIARILREENSLIIHKFFEHIKNNPEWKHVFTPLRTGDKTLQIEYSNDKIRRFLDDQSISYHHRYQSLEMFFKITEGLSVIDNKGFLNYLWLQYFLKFDREKRKINLNDKTDYILSKMIELFTDHQLKKTGAFFIVNDSQQAPFFAYNRNHNGTTEIDSSKWHAEEMDYLRNFLKGEGNNSANQKKHFKTIIEFKRNLQNEWEDLFATTLDKTVKNLGKDIISTDYNRLILVRLSKRVYLSPDKPQGIIGFYYYNDGGELTDINILRYILLLRESLSEFIENHHENDEFTNWQIAQIKQRTSLLTGHGREMLINIALNRGDKYKEIVSTLLKVQRLLIDKKEEAEEAEKMYVANSRVSKIFNSFFKNPDKLIDGAFFLGLKAMIRDVFCFEEIENAETISDENIILNIQEHLSSRFDHDLLKMFCFELIVNAKKNRWLFLGEPVHIDETYTVADNIIWIDASQVDRQLIIKIANTGPGLKTPELRKVRQKKNIKRYDNSSGIELINTVINEFGLGGIEFDQIPIKDKLYKFIVTLTLTEN
jgi:hypothetical protein